MRAACASVDPSELIVEWFDLVEWAGDGEDGDEDEDGDLKNHPWLKMSAGDETGVRKKANRWVAVENEEKKQKGADER